MIDGTSPLQRALSAEAALTDLARENEQLRKDRDGWIKRANYLFTLWVATALISTLALTALIHGAIK